ncbi:RhoGAP-domain-containing protein [Lentinula detonsa]|uniref:RhoGAP-domain-containing protein n=1 Tax=Lentinula detonsa TaxID=2804962 RepID=A0A9W8P7M5_9AGAR|nr:RhoGAP-domain-containing protein [Lentinula detonsa]
MYHIPKNNRPSGWPDNLSSSPSPSISLSSSFSSGSAVSDMLPQDSSQSDIVSSDHLASHTTPLPAPIPRHAAGHDLAITTSCPRSSSLAVVMGQNFSKPAPSHKGLSISTAAANTGIKLKRAFAGRRKKSEDSTKLFATTHNKEWDSPASSPSSSLQVTSPALKFPRPAKLTQFATQVISGAAKKAGKSPQEPAIPPTPPPKPLSMQTAKPIPSSTPTLPAKLQSNKAENRGSIIPMSPGISSAVTFMRLGEQEREAAQAKANEAVKEVSKDNSDKTDVQKDTWRKSDSTISHHTIRPGAGAGSRSSRPVSMAESLQSNHTVVPVHKRLSALITDAEFGPPEEEDDSSFVSASEEITPLPQSANNSSPNIKSRRSMSLNFGQATKYAISPTSTSAGALDDTRPRSSRESHPRMTPSLSNETPTLTRAAASGIIAPSSLGVQSTGNNIRGRLAAWTATNNATSQTHHHHHPSYASRPVPPSSYHRNTPSPQPHQRSTAISITGSLAPAANLARRAAEKLGRWGFSSNSSGYSSSSSSTGYSSDHALGRTTSNNSSAQMSSGRGKQRRTPDAPSGAWSVSSSGTLDSDAFIVPAGPSLGTQLRSPLRKSAGGAAVAGGIVFGRPLAIVVKETSVSRSPSHDSSSSFDGSELKMETPGSITSKQARALETRQLPALVVRCAQHLLLWGVGEEGLFRVNGRPSHVSKLRHEFDTGADYNLQECSPGELDPHAVASIFKAFLRELPEPILTHALLPYFEAALAHEQATNEQQRQQSTSPRAMATQRGPSLPSGPKNGLQGLRKPPSLSTLAMPNLSGIRPPSRSLLNVLRSLVKQLPIENRDLILTVADLMRATAKESQQTKMPLNNLLLVFCPSLNMNPPLLKVLCEAEDIWEVDDPDPVLDIKREDVILDISPSSEVAEAGHQARSATIEQTSTREDDESLLASAYTVSSFPTSSRVTDGHERPNLERRPTSEERIRSKKPHGPRRALHVPQVVPVDAPSNTSSLVSNEGLHHLVSTDISSDSTSLRDDGSSYISNTDTRSEFLSSPFEQGVSSPPLSSSVESLRTPSSSSAEPSMTHLPLEKSYLGKINPSSEAEVAEDDFVHPQRFLDNHLNGHIKFPSTSDDSPVTPVSLRMSAPSLSLPLASPNSLSSANSAPASPKGRRIKKPSLQLLFSKRSASSLKSLADGKPFISPPMATSLAPSVSSDSSVSTPSSAVTAQSVTFTLPPMLDANVVSSPLRLGLGFDSQLSPELQAQTLPKSNEEQHVVEPVLTPVGETPIANRYCTPSSSTLSLPLLSQDTTAPSHLRPYPTSRSKPMSKTTLLSSSSDHLRLLGDQEDQEDWTQSVLLAADAGGNWSSS